MTSARRDEKHLSFGIWCVLYQIFYDMRSHNKTKQDKNSFSTNEFVTGDGYVATGDGYPNDLEGGLMEFLVYAKPSPSNDLCGAGDGESQGLSSVAYQWASYQIRKIVDCACAGNAGNVFPRHRIQRKPRVSDPGMHHGTCVTRVSWSMSGLLTRGGGETIPGIPGACANHNFRYPVRGPWLSARLQGPELPLWFDAVASRLANGSAAFVWKLRCHWLRGIRQHQIALVIQTPVTQQLAVGLLLSCTKPSI